MDTEQLPQKQVAFFIVISLIDTISIGYKNNSTEEIFLYYFHSLEPY